MLGLNLRTKKGLFWAKILKKIEFKGQKLTNIKKKGLFGPKKQAGAELKKKKRIFGPKIGKKLIIRFKNYVILKKKKDFSGQKKQAGLSLGK